MNQSSVVNRNAPPTEPRPPAPLQLVFIHLVTAYVFGTALALLDIRSNGYIALGFWRSIGFTLLDRLLQCAAVAVAGTLAFLAIQRLLFIVWPPARRVLNHSFLACSLCENRLTALLLTVGCPLYLLCRGGSWKIGAVCALCWCAMIVVLGVVARLSKAPTRLPVHAPLAAAFGAGALLILSLGLMDPHTLQGLAFNRNNVTVAATFLAVSATYFLLLCWHFSILASEVPRRRGGRIRLVLAASVALLPLLPWIGLVLHVTPEHLAAKNRQNVIVIGIDTLRADHTALLDEDVTTGRDYTPNLRRLAHRGVVFKSAISQAPWTMPSFASVMTGKYPDEHGAVSISGYLRDRQLTIAEVLRESGYQTAGLVSHTYVDSQHGFDQGFASFNEDSALGHEAITSTAITDGALRFLSESRGGENFFLFLHYFDPHNVYQDHAEYDFSDSYTGWLKNERSLRDINQLRKFRHLLDGVDLKYLDDLYSEEISHTDAQIGRLLSYLDENHLSEDTAIIVVTDHGEEFMERGWLGHSIGLYDELIHVPLLCVLPGEQSAVPSVSEVVETRGVFDLILQYLAISAPGIRGESNLLGKIEGQRESQPSVAFSTVGLSATPVGAGDGLHVSCERTGEWKFIADYTLSREFLYQISTDPGEKINVISQFPDQANTMRDSLNAWMEKATGIKGATPQTELDKEQTESLKALGYL